MNYKQYLLICTLPLLTSCFAGGFLEKGGQSFAPSYTPNITRLQGQPYDYLCPDDKKETEESTAPKVKISDTPCFQEGESSAFYFLHMFRITDPLHPDYALSQAVQKLEGDSIIHITTWNEIHYYAFLGRVSVFKVRGAVIRFKKIEQKPEKTNEIKKGPVRKK